MAEVRLDTQMTVFQIKLHVEKRYGSDANFVSLILKDKQVLYIFYILGKSLVQPLQRWSYFRHLLALRWVCDPCC